MIPDHAPQAPRRYVWIPRSAAPEKCSRCHRLAASLTWSRALGWRCDRCSPAVGVILVELALAFPIMCGLLLAVAAVGIWLLTAQLQASRTVTLASWSAAHPTAAPEVLTAYAETVTSCDWDETIGGELVTVTISCASWAHDLLPVLPAIIETTATAFAADPSPEPSPEPSPSPSP